MLVAYDPKLTSASWAKRAQSRGESRANTAGPTSSWNSSASNLRPEPKLSITRWVRFLCAWVCNFFANLDCTGWAVFILAVLMTVWLLYISYLLITLALQYLNDVVDSDRANYAASGAAAWAKAEAARTLFAPLRARDALRASMRAGVLRGDWDVSVLEQVLAPTFATAPHLRRVELVFGASTQPFVLAVSHEDGGDGGMRVSMRSNSDECFLLGVGGCLDAPPAGALPLWLPEARRLAPETADTVMAYSSDGEYADDLHFPGDAGGWGKAVELTLQSGEGVAWANRTWIPSYQFFFLLADEAGGDYALAGQMTVEVGGLTGGRLQDERTGEDGRIFLVDRAGYVVSSRDPQDLVVVSHPGGAVRAKRLTEIQEIWSAPAASAVSRGVEQGAITENGTYYYLATPMPAPLEQFGVVVVIPDRGAFANGGMVGMSVICIILAVLPYAAGLVVACVAAWRSCSSTGEYESEEYEDGDGAPMGMRGSMLGRMATKVKESRAMRWTESVMGHVRSANVRRNLRLYLEYGVGQAQEENVGRRDSTGYGPRDSTGYGRRGSTGEPPTTIALRR